MPRKKKITNGTTTKSNIENTPSENITITSAKDKAEKRTATNVKRGPQKRTGGKINSGMRDRKKNAKGNQSPRVTLKIEGYAFEDDIIGVTHVRSDGEDAFNLTLRNMILSDALEEKGFSSFVTLRDKQSGKDDDHICGADGYPRYMFMSLNVHHFNDAKDAVAGVMQQCQNLHDVSLGLYPTNQHVAKGVRNFLTF